MTARGVLFLYSVPPTEFSTPTAHLRLSTNAAKTSASVQCDGDEVRFPWRWAPASERELGLFHFPLQQQSNTIRSFIITEGLRGPEHHAWGEAHKEG